MEDLGFFLYHHIMTGKRLIERVVEKVDIFVFRRY
jgi:hypothetical protein